ncbi:MAG TPA: endonuclease/exonuclease/phosphatase family protein, partial [Desulfobacteria bacterium]|nr:endonuclease/exonuclease/phosphatase family protein [Desulfobacteria bacterium]
MRVMTFNIRFENDQDGANSWIYRWDLVVKLIEKYDPDILGTQEGRVSQLAFLDGRLAQYKMHAPLRVLDDTCQYPTLFFHKNRFNIIEGEEFWLSKTPKVHRSKNWDSAFPRMVSTARVE